MPGPNTKRFRSIYLRQNLVQTSALDFIWDGTLHKLKTPDLFRARPEYKLPAMRFVFLCAATPYKLQCHRYSLRLETSASKPIVESITQKPLLHTLGVKNAFFKTKSAILRSRVLLLCFEGLSQVRCVEGDGHLCCTAYSTDGTCMCCNCQTAYVPASLLQLQFGVKKPTRYIICARLFLFVLLVSLCRTRRV